MVVLLEVALLVVVLLEEVVLTVVSGTVGAFRKDLVVADFIRGGGDTPDSHV